MLSSSRRWENAHVQAAGVPRRTTGPCAARVRPPVAVRTVGRLVAATGAINVVAAVVPPERARLRMVTEVIPVVGVQTAHAATAAIGLLLIYLGFGLRRGNREAWYVAVALAAASVLLNLVKSLDIDGAAISAALLALLIAVRNQFRAAAEPASRWRALGALLGFASAGYLLGVAEIWLRSSRLAPGQSPRLWFVHVAYGMVGLTGPLRFTSSGVAGAVSITTGAMGLLAVGVSLVILLRPWVVRPGLSAEDDRRLRELLDRHGRRDSLGYFALRDDKSVIWSTSGKAAIAYRVVSGVSLASGDPLGDPEAWTGAVSAWLDECGRHGLTPAVLGCGELAGRVYQRHGLDVIELGDEAVVNAEDFTLDGRAMRGVRQAVARLDRAGYRCQVARQSSLAPHEVAEAVRASEELRDGDVERGFSMALSRIGDAADPDCVLALARDAEGRLRGLLQFVPWGLDGLSLDLMRRDRTSDNGVIEFMVVAVLREAPRLGVRRLSLNFAVLRWVFARSDQLGAGPILRASRPALVMASRVWQLESLYRANAKYRPAWQPRYLCFPTMRDLPRIGVAALRAEAFLAPPRPSGRPARRRPEPPGRATGETDEPLAEAAAAVDGAPQ
jgi:lysyl-tRNA synthetase class 2